jgi:hypothetical protein
MSLGEATHLLLVPLVVGGLLLLILFFLGFRHKRLEMAHRERLAALEKGVPIPSVPETPMSRVYLLRGMIWLFTGLGLTIFLFGLSRTPGESRRPEFVLSERLQMEKYLKERGATEDQIKEVMAQRQSESQRREQRGVIPGAIALIGLAPIGVGLAYILFFAIESGRLARRGD